MNTVIENIKATKPECERSIYVLLVRYPDLFSKIFRLVSRGYYNHASIGIHDAGETFYSYVTTGFRKELPKQHPTFKQREVPCRLYQVKISDDLYNVTKAVLNNHEKQAYQCKYSILGVMLCFLHIVYTRRNRYFCSQFVSEILEQMGAVTLEKHSCLYLPDDFTKIRELSLSFSGNLSQLVNKWNTSPPALE